MLNLVSDLLIQFIYHFIANILLILTKKSIEVDGWILIIGRLKKFLILIFFILRLVVFLLIYIRNLRHSSTVLDKLLNFLMAKLAMPYVFIIKSKVFSVQKKIWTTGTEDISTKSAMMPTTYDWNKILGTVLTFGLVFVLDPVLLGTYLGT